MAQESEQCLELSGDVHPGSQQETLRPNGRLSGHGVKLTCACRESNPRVGSVRNLVVDPEEHLAQVLGARNRFQKYLLRRSSQHEVGGCDGQYERRAMLSDVRSDD